MSVMGLTRYNKAIEVLKKYVEDSGRDFIYTADLRGLVIREIGGDENRTVVPTLKMLRELRVINEVSVNKWEINLS